MTDRQTAILDTLRNGPSTTAEMMRVTQAPEGTIRRNIQALRKMGHNILQSVVGGRSRYTLDLLNTTSGTTPAL